MKFTINRPAANPMTEMDLSLSAEVRESDDGFVVELTAKGTGLTTPPFTVNAETLIKDSDTVAGNFPSVRIGDAIAGVGIPADTKIVAVSDEQIQLSKPTIEAGANITLTVTPPKSQVQLCSIPMRINSAVDPQRGTIFEVSSALLLSTGEYPLGRVELPVDAELTHQRIPRK